MRRHIYCILASILMIMSITVSPVFALITPSGPFIPSDDDGFEIDLGFDLGCFTISGVTVDEDLTEIDEEISETRYQNYEIYLDADTEDDETITVSFDFNDEYEFEASNYEGIDFPIVSTYCKQHMTQSQSADNSVNAILYSNEDNEFEISLEDGEAEETFYIYYSDNHFDGVAFTQAGVVRMPLVLTLTFMIGEPDNPAYLLDVIPIDDSVQMERMNTLINGTVDESLHYGYGVVSYDELDGPKSFNVELVFSEDCSGMTVSVNGGSNVLIPSSLKLKTSLYAVKPQKIDDTALRWGYENTISLSYAGFPIETYTVYGIEKRFPDLPDRVIDYLCIGSQYTNSDSERYNDYGTRAVRSMVGSNYDAGGGASGPVSLGNFGGYIVYEYDEPIMDDPNNPYGIDFITFGNSVEGSNEFGEPGQVWVSEDNANWYALAGSMHYENYADWEYEIEYKKTEDGFTEWYDSHDSHAVQPQYTFPLEENYPLYSFDELEDPGSIVLKGIYFSPDGDTNEYGNIRPPFAAFGYVDEGKRGTSLETDDQSGWTDDIRYEMMARNIGQNPYLGTYDESGRVWSSVTDGMDLAWAVNAEGEPVSFPDGIRFIKIVSATNIENGAIGEKSTEVNMVRVARANDSAVGVSDAPASISFDGIEVDLTKGTAIGERNNVFSFTGDAAVAVDGEFEVKVDAPEGSHVYINNNPVTSVTYDKIPDHEIVRVIVQNDECEPLIYVFNLRQMTEDEKAAEAVDELIEAIGDPEDVTLESAAAITAASDAYDALTDAQKALVTKADDLAAAKAKYAELEAAAEQAEIDEAAAKGVDDAIEAIGDVTLDSESAITAARAAYDALTDEQKALVTKADDLTAAEEALVQLKEDAPVAKAVEDQIAAIGEVTKYKKDAIENARIAYEALTDSQKALVGNLDVLEAAEAELDELLNGSGSEDTIRVSFRLIGSTIATEDVDLSKGEEGYHGAEYQTWIKTKTYTMHSDDSVYDLFVKATGDAGVESKGASSGYVSSIKAPEELGGYWLSEFTNGKKSGWMYTMNGRHTDAIKDQKLVDGAKVIFHYVNDYSYEVEDWFDEPLWPSQATDDTFYSRWLEAPDVNPSSQGGGGTTPAEEPEVVDPVDTPEDPNGGATVGRFIDVDEDDWFADAVDYAVENGFMVGTGEDTFSPQKTLTRGMLASMLYSMEGAPAEDGTTSFTDIDPSDWFAKGVEWAVENGVAAGYGERFGPNDDITREQMVVMLYGYAKMKGYELVEGEDLSGYEDAGEISSWALPAMQWAKAAGLVSGRSATKMAPLGTTTRAEAATIMRNFLENVAK